MFVAIDNKDKSPIDVEDLIQITRSNGEITPEFAMEVLSLTNHSTNIKKLVRAIKDKCKTKEDILPYKEFIVSCVDSREVSEEALTDLREIASLCGCDKEFEVAKDKPKFYGKFDCNNAVIVKSEEELEALEGENLTVYFDADKVYLKNYNLSKVKALKFREGAEVNLSCAKNLPKGLDVSMCSKVDLIWCDLEGLNLTFREGADVNLEGAYNLPKDLDVSMCSKVDLSNCNVEGLNLKFREGAEVDLGEAKNLPKDLDFSQCSKVDLYGCDLEGINLKFREGADVDLAGCKNLPKDLDVSQFSVVNLSGCNLRGLNLKFREGAEVGLIRVYNLPKDLDVSMCSEVELNGCDLEGLNLKFREGAEVSLGGAKNLPKDLDVSMCSWVNLSVCDLEGLNLKFREGAFVELRMAKYLPEVLDLSMCSKVDLEGCDFRGVKKIKFRNMRQHDESCIYEKDFSGEFVYADEDKGGAGMVPPGYGGAEM